MDSLSFLKTNDILKNVKIELLEKFTQPPPRYNQSTLLQKMEREKIGTKATRSEIISTLFKRNYITSFVPSATTTTNQSVTYDSKVSKSVPISHNQKEQTNKVEYTGIQKSGLRPTEIGIAIVSSMKKYIPNIVSTSLTRDMETQLEQIESGNTTSVRVVDKARSQIKEAIQSFNLNESKIGQEISSAFEANRTTSPSRKPAASSYIRQVPCLQEWEFNDQKGDKIQKKICRLYKIFINKMHGYISITSKRYNKKSLAKSVKNVIGLLSPLVVIIKVKDTNGSFVLIRYVL